MPGLLDYFGEPSTQQLLGLSAGLLAAGGPNTRKMGVGQGLSQGLLLGSNLSNDAYRGRLMNLQAQFMQGSMAQRNFMMQLAAQLGGGQPSSVPPPSGVPSPSGGTSPASPTRFPFNLHQIAALQLAGGPDLTNTYNAAQPKATITPSGVMYNEKDGSTMGTVPVVSEAFGGYRLGQGPGGFSMAPLPGSADMRRTQLGVAEGVKAENEVVQVPDPNGPAGATIPMRKSDYLKAIQGVQGATSAPPVAQTGSWAGQGPMKFSDMSIQEQNAARALRVAGGGSITLPSSPQQFGRVPSPSELESAKAPAVAKTKALETAAEGDAKKVLSLEEKIPNQLSVLRRLDRMEALTNDSNSYAAAGAEIKSMLGSIAQAFGLEVKKDKTANTEEYLAHVAELLKDRLASKDYGSGTGISNLDILAAQKPLPELTKTNSGRLQLINALRADTQRNIKDAQAARDYFDANAGLRGFRYPSEVESEKNKLVNGLPKEPSDRPVPGLPQGVRVTRLR